MARKPRKGSGEQWLKWALYALGVVGIVGTGVGVAMYADRLGFSPFGPAREAVTDTSQVQQQNSRAGSVDQPSDDEWDLKHQKQFRDDTRSQLRQQADKNNAIDARIDRLDEKDASIINQIRELDNSYNGIGFSGVLIVLLVLGWLIWLTWVIQANVNSLEREMSDQNERARALGEDLKAINARIEKLSPKSGSGTMLFGARGRQDSEIDPDDFARSRQLQQNEARAREREERERKRAEQRAEQDKLKNASERFCALMNRGTAAREDFDEIIAAFAQKWMITENGTSNWNDEDPRGQEIVIFGDDRFTLRAFPAFYASQNLASSHNNALRTDQIFHEWFDFEERPGHAFEMLYPAHATISDGVPQMVSKGRIVLPQS